LAIKEQLNKNYNQKLLRREFWMFREIVNFSDTMKEV